MLSSLHDLRRLLTFYWARRIIKKRNMFISLHNIGVNLFYSERHGKIVLAKR